MAIDSYTNLKTAITAWATRTGDTDFTGEEDNFIQLAEAKFNRKLGSDYRRITTATVNTDSTGLATLPTGFVLMRSIVRNVSGSLPLTPTSWAALTTLNPDGISDDAYYYAIRGTSLKVTPITDDDFIATYERTLVALSGSNASNWLLETAPDAYLDMCIAQGHAFNEDWQNAAIYEQRAMGVIDDVVSQGQVAQFANAEVVVDGPTP